MTRSTSEPFAARVINWLILRRARSLRVRLALWGLLLFGLTQLLVSAALYAAVSAWLEDQVNNTLRLTAAQVSSVIYDSDEPQQPLDIADIALKFSASTNIATQGFVREQLFFVRLIDRATGAALASSADYPIAPPVGNVQEAAFDTVSVVVEGASVPLRIYTLPLVYAPPHALQAGVSLEETHAIQRGMLGILALLLLVTGTLTPLSGWFLAERALVPIRAVGRMAIEINETDLARRLDLASSEVELAQLVQTFNAMLDRLEEAFRRQRQFTADAAHELRTPLAIMQTHLDVTLSQPRSAAEYQAALVSVQEEVRRLSYLASALLMLAHADAHELPLHLQRFDLSLMLHAVVDQFAPAAQEKRITIRRDITPAMSLNGDEDRLIQVVFNLMDNAIKFTVEGGQVRVSAQAANQRIEIVVEDTGPGIPLEEQARIFDRFYRADTARSRKTGGFGLGLAIARRIVELHDGTIRIVSQPGQGTRFVVSLPH